MTYWNIAYSKGPSGENERTVTRLRPGDSILAADPRKRYEVREPGTDISPGRGRSERIVLVNMGRTEKVFFRGEGNGGTRTETGNIV